MANEISRTDKEQTSPQGEAASSEAIRHLKQTIAGGKHWYLALLEAIGLWTLSEETRGERRYRYLIDNEAFDWLLLAERLCTEVDGMVPEQERVDLLFFGKPPFSLPQSEFRKLIGSAKYRAYLNYYYGVIVEGVLLLTVEDEVRKERQGAVSKKDDVTDEAFRRIYGADRSALLDRFRDEIGYPKAEAISLAELHHFTYWLFKYRVKNSDPARVASDTRKGLDYLEKLRHPPQAPEEIANNQ